MQILFFTLDVIYSALLNNQVDKKDLPGVGFVVTGTGLVGVILPKTDKAAIFIEKIQESLSRFFY